ncbi:MAG TPA: DUF2306 domain-containing protein [Longimicrobium sp.]|jgi:uncharacterized membrane protein|uniref:DUF2306 domain-containing protein n=1 Tax=Longimicrobium sp. TaxID=2029185 RepID=UPI002ED8DE23
MISLGWTHTIAASTALVAGAAVLLTRKGTRRHRQVGWVYVVSMLLLNGTALLIYRLFGRFGPFHVGAIFSFVTVVAGTAAALGARRARARRDPVARARALERHYQWMTWSYVGLAAAAVSEIATRMPALRPRPGQGMAFGITVAVATLLVIGVGAQLIRRRRTALLAPYRPATGGRP